MWLYRCALHRCDCGSRPQINRFTGCRDVSWAVESIGLGASSVETANFNSEEATSRVLFSFDHRLQFSDPPEGDNAVTDSNHSLGMTKENVKRVNYPPVKVLSEQ